jgi:hypothetical protein
MKFYFVIIFGLLLVASMANSAALVENRARRDLKANTATTLSPKELYNLAVNMFGNMWTTKSTKSPYFDIFGK